MEINGYELIAVLWVHWFADFCMQTDTMAQNKSTSNKWLASHILVYTVFLLPFGWQFALVNAVAHYATDYVSSRATSYLWQKGDRHNFFVVIGIDQAMHLTVLVATMPLINYWDII